MKRIKRDCYFQSEWLDDKLFPDFKLWLQKHSSSEGKCIVCKKNDKQNFTILSVSKMGVTALTKHAETLGHIKNMKAVLSQKPINNLFNKNSKNITNIPDPNNNASINEINNSMTHENNLNNNNGII